MSYYSYLNNIKVNLVMIKQFVWLMLIRFVIKVKIK